MELVDILSKDCVFVCSDVRDKPELFARLSLKGAELVGCDAQSVYDALMAREELGSTGLGNGIAIPHGKFAGLAGVRAVFARLLTAIDFDAVDDQPVDLVMMLLAPTGAGADHLKALARVARLFRTENLVEALRRTQDRNELYAILTRPQAAAAA